MQRPWGASAPACLENSKQVDVSDKSEQEGKGKGCDQRGSKQWAMWGLRAIVRGIPRGLHEAERLYNTGMNFGTSF